MITYKDDGERDGNKGRIGTGSPRQGLREAMGLSLRDLAERSGVSAPMLSQVERGETSPTLVIAERIASGLDLTLSQCCASTRASTWS